MADSNLQTTNVEMPLKNEHHTNDHDTPQSQLKFQEVRSKVAHFLHNNHMFHLVITGLVVLDVVIVVTQLILEASREKGHCVLSVHSITNNTTNSKTNVTTAHLEEAESHHTITTVEHVLHYLGITILCIFMVEIFVKLFAFGVTFFKHKLEILDAVVVTVAFVLDIALSEEAAHDAVTLLILVRLWRVLSIVTSIVEAVEIAAMEREEKIRVQLEALQKENDYLKTHKNQTRVLEEYTGTKET